MTAPPGLAPIAEPGAVAYQAVGDTDPAPDHYVEWCARHQRDPESKRTQESYLLDSGAASTRNEARLLIRAYVLDQRDRDARELVREEFGGWLQSNYWRAVGRRPAPSLSKTWAVRSS